MTEHPPVFCSFYTSRTYKDLCLEKLIPSFRRFDLDFRVDPMPDLGSWSANVRQKAPYLAWMLLKYPDRPVVWIDADGEILAPPERLLDMPPGVEIAAHVWPHRWDGKPELWSSTLFLRPQARPWMLAWAAKNEEEGRKVGWSDPGLQEVLSGASLGDRFCNLPAEYAWVEYVMRAALPKAEPVILQARVSRPMWASR